MGEMVIQWLSYQTFDALLLRTRGASPRVSGALARVALARWRRIFFKDPRACEESGVTVASPTADWPQLHESRTNSALTKKNICSILPSSGTPADGAGLGSASLHPPCASPLQLARSADRTGAVLAPASASVDQGPGVLSFPFPPRTCFEVDLTDATPAQFVSLFESRPVFQLPSAPKEKPPSFSQDWEKEGGWGMDEGRNLVQNSILAPRAYTPGKRSPNRFSSSEPTARTPHRT